jgi:hypothetical protein
MVAALTTANPLLHALPRSTEEYKRSADEELTQCDYSKTLHYTQNLFLLLPDRRIGK